MMDLSHIESVELKFKFDNQDDVETTIEMYGYLVDDHNNSGLDPEYKAEMDHWAVAHDDKISLIIVLTKLKDEEYKHKNNRD
jgi:hypothetical protein